MYFFRAKKWWQADGTEFLPPLNELAVACSWNTEHLEEFLDTAKTQCRGAGGEGREGKGCRGKGKGEGLL